MREIKVDAGRTVTLTGGTTTVTETVPDPSDEDGDGNLTETESRTFPTVRVEDDRARDVITMQGDNGVDEFTLISTLAEGGRMTAVEALHVQGTRLTIIGTKRSENDTLIVLGHDGNDRINALGMGDADEATAPVFPDLLALELYGGAGNDVLMGTPFNDVIDGGLGDDRLTGGAGWDQFRDAGGNDVLVEAQDTDLALYRNLFVAGQLLNAGGALPTELALIAAMGLAVLPTRRTMGDADNFAATAIVEDITGLFEAAELTGGDSVNTIVVNDLDGTIRVGTQSLTVGAWNGDAILDGRGAEAGTGAETYVISMPVGSGGRIQVLDSGGASGVDRIVFLGSSQGDQITLDAAGTGPSKLGIVRAEGVATTFTTFRGIERAEIYLGDGADRVLSNDTAAVTVIELGSADDEIIVGTVPLIPDTGNRTLEFPDGIPVVDTQNMTNGNSNPLFVLGDNQNDRFEVNHNRAKLYLHGGDGNDRFILKTFLVLKENPDSPEEVTNLANLFGGTGTNRYDYLQNAPVQINGGGGTDTLVIVGTPIGDVFIITDTLVAGAGRIVFFSNIEVVEVDGGGGADEIYVLATGAGFETIITGGSGDDVIHIGGDAPTLVFDPPSFTYTPPAFSVQMPPDVVTDETVTTLTNFSFTISYLDWLARGGATNPDAVAASLLADWVGHWRSVMRLFGASTQIDAIDVRNVTWSLRWSFLWGGFLLPQVQVNVGSFGLRTRVQRLVPVTKLVQPAPITVDPLPYGFDAPRSLDASRILGRLTIRGGDQFEGAGDKVVFHNSDGSRVHRPAADARRHAHGAGRRDPGRRADLPPGDERLRHPAAARPLPQPRGRGPGHRDRRPDLDQRRHHAATTASRCRASSTSTSASPTARPPATSSGSSPRRPRRS